MTEDPTSSGAPTDGLSEEQVARLLADAAGASDAGPVPPDVAARLDTVLAGLVAERATEPVIDSDTGRGTEGGQPAPVAPIADARDRRRRTWAPRLLVAAAVLGVAGVGFSVATDLGSGSDEAISAGSSAESADAGSGEGAGDSTAPRDEAAEELLSPDLAGDDADPAAGLRITDAASLRAAVRLTGGRDTALRNRKAAPPVTGGLDSRALVREHADCVAPSGPGRRAVVTYQGDPATLVVRRVGDRLDGRVYDCALGLQLDGVEIGPAGE